MFSFKSLFTLAAFIVGATASPVKLADDVVKELDVTAYAGRWYQTHANQIVYSTFEKDAVCVTADYSLLADGTVGVYNTQRVKTPTGEFKDITGKAYAPDPAEPGKLIVDLEGAPVQGTYWVMQLGPVVDGKYEYSIVADQLYPLGTLFVLSRNPSLGSYEPEVVARLNELGFNKFFNKPIATLQAGCTYPPTPSALPIASFADPTVKEVDIPKYMGRWYNVEASAVTMSLFQKDCTCVTATYDLKDNGTVGVLNRCRKYAPNGELSVITGSAFVPDASAPGKLLVSLDGVPFPAPYWIVSLGPVENDFYQYAIVTDSFLPTGNMWVLIRDVAAVPRFEKEINARLTALGFDLTTIVPIVQEGCLGY